MKKVKMFANIDCHVLEDKVNEFTAEHPASITDIQYRVIYNDCSKSPIHCAMIVYDTSLDTMRDKASKLGEKLHGLFEGGETN